MSQYIDDFTCIWNKVTVVTVQSQYSFHRHLHHALLAIFPDNGFHRHLHPTMHAIFPDVQSDCTILESSQIISSHKFACHFYGRQSVHISDNMSPTYICTYTYSYIYIYTHTHIHIYTYTGGQAAGSHCAKGATALIRVYNQEVIESFRILYIVSHNTVVIWHTPEKQGKRLRCSCGAHM